MKEINKTAKHAFSCRNISVATVLGKLLFTVSFLGVSFWFLVFSVAGFSSLFSATYQYSNLKSITHRYSPKRSEVIITVIKCHGFVLFTFRARKLKNKTKKPTTSHQGSGTGRSVALFALFLSFLF